MMIARSTVRGIVLLTMLVSAFTLSGPARVARAAGEVGQYMKQPATASTCDTSFINTSIPVLKTCPRWRTWTAMLVKSVSDGTNSGEKRYRRTWLDGG